MTTIKQPQHQQNKPTPLFSRPSTRPCGAGRILGLAAVVIATSGCVQSTIATGMGSSASLMSSASSSEFISSPFRSSSESSGQQQEEKIEEETTIYTAQHLDQGGDAEQLMLGISALCASNGISDWEGSDYIWTGVGRGFADAGFAQQQMVDYAESLSSPNRDVLTLLLQGYQRGAPQDDDSLLIP